MNVEIVQSWEKKHCDDGDGNDNTNKPIVIVVEY